MKKLLPVALPALVLALTAGLMTGCETGPGVSPPDARAFSAGPAGSHAAPEGSPADGSSGAGPSTGSSTN